MHAYLIIIAKTFMKNSVFLEKLLALKLRVTKQPIGTSDIFKVKDIL